MKALDKAGREVRPGDLIIYGHALGRCAGLRYGKVLAITWKTAFYRGEKKEPHFTVQGVDTDWSDWDHRGQPELCGRKGTLQYGSRILVLERDQVPMAVLELLDSVEVEDG